MRRLKKAVLPGLLLLAVYYPLFGGEYSLFELRAARAELQQQQAELRELRQEIDSLRAWADSLSTDSATLERIARERFGLVRPGEVLYRFAGPEDSAAARPDSSGLQGR